MPAPLLHSEQEKARYLQLIDEGYEPALALRFVKAERTERAIQNLRGESEATPTMGSVAQIDSAYNATRGDNLGRSIDSARTYHQQNYGGDMNRVPANELLEYLNMLERQRGGR